MERLNVQRKTMPEVSVYFNAMKGMVLLIQSLFLQIVFARIIVVDGIKEEIIK